MDACIVQAPITQTNAREREALNKAEAPRAGASSNWRAPTRTMGISYRLTAKVWLKRRSRVTSACGR